MGAPEKDFSNKVVELVSVHIKECLDAAGLPAGLGGATTPLVIDRESRRDVYLLGYVSGWCDVILAPARIDLGDEKENISALVFLSLFGGNGASAMFAKLFEQNSLVPIFERGIAQGREVVEAIFDGEEPPNYLLMHLRRRQLN
jgi:hypothetical protein